MQPTVFHTHRPSAQCGPRSFPCGQCHDSHFTICYIWVLASMPLVQPCMKFPHLQSTFVRLHPTLLWAEPTLYKYDRSAHLGPQLLDTFETTFACITHTSNGLSNLFMSAFLRRLPKENVPDAEVVKSCQDDYVICKWRSANGSLCAHHPWLLLRSIQLTGGSARLVLTPRSLDPPPLKMVVTLRNSSKTYCARLLRLTHLLKLTPQSLCNCSTPFNPVGSCC